jgi:hypothetical protein
MFGRSLGRKCACFVYRCVTFWTTRSVLEIHCPISINHLSQYYGRFSALRRLDRMTFICVYVYGSRELCLALAAFQFLNPIHSLDGGSARRKTATYTQNKPIQTSMPWVGFKPTTPSFERTKTVHALDRAATVIRITFMKGKFSLPVSTTPL